MNAYLDERVKAVCPVHGVSVGRWNDKSTWRIDFRAEATVQERAAAQAVVDAFDTSDPRNSNELEADCQGYLNGGASQIDPRKVMKAKFISDLAFRLGKAPGALTNAELLAERNRIAAIYKTL